MTEKSTQSNERMVKDMLFMDVVSFAMPSDKPNDLIVPFKRDANGYLKGRAIIAAIGIQQYKLADGGVIRLLRHPDDVFKEESLRSLEGLPLVIEHPKKLFAPDALPTNQDGFTGDRVMNDAYYIYAPITVTTAKAQKGIESGEMKELSVGYKADLVYSSGEYHGQAYDARQTNIRGNHLAIVKKARAGKEASFVLADGDESKAYEIADAVLMDSIDTTLLDSKENKHTQQGGPMLAKFTLKSGQVVEADQAFIDAHTAVLGECETAKVDLLTAQKNLTEAQATIAAKDVALSDAKNAKIDEAAVLAAANELVAVRELAKAAGVEIKDDATAKVLRVAVVKKVMPDVTLNDGNDIEVNAYFNASKGLLASRKDQSEANRLKMQGGAFQDSADKDKKPEGKLSAASIMDGFRTSLANAHNNTKEVV